MNATALREVNTYLFQSRIMRKSDLNRAYEFFISKLSDDEQSKLDDSDAIIEGFNVYAEAGGSLQELREMFGDDAVTVPREGDSELHSMGSIQKGQGSSYFQFMEHNRFLIGQTVKNIEHFISSLSLYGQTQPVSEVFETYLELGGRTSDLIDVANDRLPEVIAKADLSYAKDIIDVVTNVTAMGIKGRVKHRRVQNYLLSLLTDDEYFDCSSREGVVTGYSRHFEDGGTSGDLREISEDVETNYTERVKTHEEVSRLLFLNQILSPAEHKNVNDLFLSMNDKGDENHMIYSELIVKGFNTYWKQGGSMYELKDIAKGYIKSIYDEIVADDYNAVLSYLEEFNIQDHEAKQDAFQFFVSQFTEKEVKKKDPMSLIVKGFNIYFEDGKSVTELLKELEA